MNKDTAQLELKIAKILRLGVFVAGFFIGIGWILQIDFYHNIFEDYRTYQESSLLENLNALWAQSSWGVLLIYLGLLVLVSLPLIRVLLTGVVFLKQKDYAMAGIVLLVLSGLVLSLALGIDL